MVVLPRKETRPLLCKYWICRHRQAVALLHRPHLGAMVANLQRPSLKEMRRDFLTREASQERMGDWQKVTLDVDLLKSYIEGSVGIWVYFRLAAERPPDT
jgi:hypothetical protein